MSVIRLSFCSENFHIFHKGRAKTLLICMCQLLNTTKVEIFFSKIIQFYFSKAKGRLAVMELDFKKLNLDKKRKICSERVPEDWFYG